MFLFTAAFYSQYFCFIKIIVINFCMKLIDKASRTTGWSTCSSYNIAIQRHRVIKEVFNLILYLAISLAALPFKREHGKVVTLSSICFTNVTEQKKDFIRNIRDIHLVQK